MYHYGSKTPKRTILWSSSPSIGMFWTHKLKRVEYLKKVKQDPSHPQPTKQYIDSEGRKRYHGTSALKQTECGAQLLCVGYWGVARPLLGFFSPLNKQWGITLQSLLGRLHPYLTSWCPLAILSHTMIPSMQLHCGSPGLLTTCGMMLPWGLS